MSFFFLSIFSPSTPFSCMWISYGSWSFFLLMKKPDLEGKKLYMHKNCIRLIVDFGRTWRCFVATLQNTHFFTQFTHFSFTLQVCFLSKKTDTHSHLWMKKTRAEKILYKIFGGNLLSAHKHTNTHLLLIYNGVSCLKFCAGAINKKILRFIRSFMPHFSTRISHVVFHFFFFYRHFLLFCFVFVPPSNLVHMCNEWKERVNFL